MYLICIWYSCFFLHSFSGSRCISTFQPLSSNIIVMSCKFKSQIWNSKSQRFWLLNPELILNVKKIGYEKDLCVAIVFFHDSKRTNSLIFLLLLLLVIGYGMFESQEPILANIQEQKSCSYGSCHYSYNLFWRCVKILRLSLAIVLKQWMVLEWIVHTFLNHQPNELIWYTSFMVKVYSYILLGY